jgi:predicted ATPase
MRVGINTGLVVVGDLGSDLGSDMASEYLALGDAINLAARIEATAEPMTVYVSDDTRRLAEPMFEWVDRGRFDLKGKSEPIRMWQVVGRRDGQTAMRGFADIRAPMVGRDADLDRLLATTEALERDRKGAIATITGEPGIGKTRLVSEWRERVMRGPDPPAWITASCVSYGRRLSYHVVVDLLRSAIGSGESMGPQEMRSLLSAAAVRYLDSSLEAEAVLADLLSLSLALEEEQIVHALDSQARQARYLTAISDLLRHRAAERPMVALIQDVHWADPTSVLFLRRLLPLSAAAPILFCLTSRPDFDAPVWPLLSEVGAIAEAPVVGIELDRLAADDAGALVHALLDAAGIPRADEASLLAHAEGNPFFAEELVRMIIDKTGEGGASLSGTFDGEIPATIHGLLLARLDTLPAPARRTARLASVVGRRFSTQLLEEVRPG